MRYVLRPSFTSFRTRQDDTIVAGSLDGSSIALLDGQKQRWAEMVVVATRPQLGHLEGGNTLAKSHPPALTPIPLEEVHCPSASCLYFTLTGRPMAFLGRTVQLVHGPGSRKIESDCGPRSRWAIFNFRQAGIVFRSRLGVGDNITASRGHVISLYIADFGHYTRLGTD